MIICGRKQKKEETIEKYKTKAESSVGLLEHTHIHIEEKQKTKNSSWASNLEQLNAARS